MNAGSPPNRNSRSAGVLRRTVPALRPALIWASPWGAFAYISGERNAHATRDWIAMGILVAINLYYLFAVLLTRKSADLPRGLVFLGFAFTFAALAGAYAGADLAAAHTYSGCYVDAQGTSTNLGGIDSVYYALSTLSTAGFGDITSHTQTCRALTVTEIAIGVPTLGLSIAGVAARIFKDLQS